jgi:diguanylate cyclase (GGDEF)-like protein
MNEDKNSAAAESGKTDITSQNMSNFEMLSLNILTRLTMQDTIDEEIIDNLRNMGMEYYTLLKKYEVVDKRANLDEKTALLKFNESFLVNIVKAMSRYWAASKKSHIQPMAYMRMDLDDFSRINNRYGHDMGDKVLVEVSNILKKLTRPTDYLFRFGGEEFDIVLPVTDIDGAKVCSDKILEGIREIRIPLDKKKNIKITASMGISAFDIDFQKMVSIVSSDVMVYYRKAQKEADNACYEAKYLGKNRYCVFNPAKDYQSVMRAYSSKTKHG